MAQPAPQYADEQPRDTPTADRQARQAGKAHTNPYTEYVSAGGPYWYADALASLPHPIDDVTMDFGDDLYDRMLYDAQMASLVNVFKTGMLEDGLTLSPAVEDADENHAAAAELADWCTWVLDRLTIPLDDVLWDLADAAPYGNRVAELVYEQLPGPDGATQILLTKVAPKPRRMTAFVVDPFNNVVGLLGQVPGKAFYVQTAQIVDPGSMENFLDREHFALLTFRIKDGDPRGQSLLRPAYDPWYTKKQIQIEYLKFLAQFASPGLIGYTAVDVDDDPEYDDQGNQLVTPSPEVAMAGTLATFRNSIALAFPNGAKVDLVKSDGEGQAHLLGIALQNREMAKAITSQTLGTEEGEHQTRASSGTHQDILDTIVRPGKRGVERMVRTDLLTPLIRWNFGEKALQLLPKVTLGSLEQHDFATTATAIAALAAAKYFQQSQLPLVDMFLGLPIRDLADADPPPVATPPVATPGADPANPDQDGQPAAAPGAPVDPEQQAARAFARAARAYTLQRARAKAAARPPILHWDGATLRTWLKEAA